jgi:lipopolysaccharide export system protein LptA
MRPDLRFYRYWPIALWLLCSQGQALPNDRDQPIRIAAQEAVLDQRQGVTIYSGDVQFSQGSMLVKADRVTAHFNPESQKIEKIHAEGSPALYQQSTDDAAGEMRIEATSVTAQFNSATQRISAIDAAGSPALYQQKPASDKGVISARANNIRYTPSEEQLLLLENASLEQDGASMSASRIVYNIRDEVMQAAGQGDSGRERIEIIIPPNFELEN